MSAYIFKLVCALFIVASAAYLGSILGYRRGNRRAIEDLVSSLSRIEMTHDERITFSNVLQRLFVSVVIQHGQDRIVK